ncbi:MAG: HAD family phosphatase [bacterium]
MIPVWQQSKALIFDCDGTLTDSMPLHMESWARAFADFGEPYRSQFLDALKGMNEEKIVQLYNKEFNSNLNAKQLVETKHRYFQEKAHLIKPIDPVVQTARKYAKKLPLAVVSGGRRKNVLATLSSLDLEQFFTVILTADDLLPPKPAPDMFLEAARQLGVEPEFCQVFEDGDLGLEAARKAGMKAVDIREIIINNKRWKE